MAFTINYNDPAQAEGYNVMRDVMISVLGSLPEVGFILGPVATAFFPTAVSHPTPQEKLEKAMKELQADILTHVWAGTVQGKVDEIAKAAKPVPSDATQTTAVIELCYEDEDYFFDPASAGCQQDPPPYQDTLGYTALFGSIYLSALRDRVRCTDQIYKDARYASQTGNIPTMRPGPQDSVLATKMSQFQTSMDIQYQFALQWRKAQVTAKDNSYDVQGPSGGPVPVSEHHTQWDVTDSQGVYATRSFGDVDSARQYYRNIMWDIYKSVGGFADRMSDVIDASRYWCFMNSPQGSNNVSHGYQYRAIRIGDGMRIGNYTSHHDYYVQYGDMSRLDLWWDDGALKGIQVWYNGQSPGLHGVTTSSWATIDVAGDGLINNVCYDVGDWVDRCAFNTSARANKKLGPVGNKGGTSLYYPAHSPITNDDTRLAYIGVIDNGDVISQLQLVWRTGIDHAQNLPDHQTVQVLYDYFQAPVHF